MRRIARAAGVPVAALLLAPAAAFASTPASTRSEARTGNTGLGLEAYRIIARSLPR